MTRDLDDTVIVPRAAPAARPAEPDEADTIVRASAALPVSSEPAPSVLDGPVQAGGPRSGRRFGIRVGDAEPIPLDVPSIVGRRPRSPRVPAPHAPRLVTVASASRLVSATHLEVRQVGDSVVVTDLHSTNGSVVRMPGARPQSLRQGESAVVGAGAVIDLGDRVMLEIVALHRVTAGSRR